MFRFVVRTAAVRDEQRDAGNRSDDHDDGGEQLEE
jgi:hypothetical protein